MVEVRSEQTVMPYDETLLERAQTQWQFGDWSSLARLDVGLMQNHPNRAELALLAAAGCLHACSNEAAREYIGLAEEWGMDNRRIGQILISVAHNSLGRAAAIDRQRHRALQHFEYSISVCAPRSEFQLIAQARFEEQSRQLEARNLSLEAIHLQQASTKPEVASVSSKKPSFDIAGANRLVDGIVLTSQSQKRWPYFLKIEELQIALFLQLIAEAKPQHFFDIGANVGFYTLVAQKYFPKLHCIAFEPTPDTFANLAENLKSNEREGGAEAECLALSSRAGTAEFGDFGDCSGKNSILSTSIHEPGSLKNRIRVAMECLDDRYADKQGRCIVKIDAEGHEPEILKGGARFFRQNEIVLQVETGHKENAQDLDQLIRSFNLEPVFKLGPDSYYTNIPALIKEAKYLDILERANRFVIAHRWDVEQSFS